MFMVCLAYELVAAETACSRCGAGLSGAASIAAARRAWWGGSRCLVVRMHCQSGGHHCYTAKVTELKGDLRLRPLRRRSVMSGWSQ